MRRRTAARRRRAVRCRRLNGPLRMAGGFCPPLLTAVARTLSGETGDTGELQCLRPLPVPASPDAEAVRPHDRRTL